MEEITMLPCPHCGNTQIDYCDEPSVSFSYCSKCCMCGPRADDKILAADRWNALPRRLKWTREKPTQEGFWFCRYGETVWVYWLTWNDRRLKISGLFPSKSESFIDELDEFEGLEWAGPIPEPEE